MQKLITKLLLAAAPMLTLPAFAQQEQVAKVAAAQVQRELSDEQVHLVHSQPWYVSGERLWFSASVTKSSTAPPSRVLYVELLDAKGNVLANQRLVVENGRAHGDFILPQDLPSGSYTLQAGTNWMKNFSTQQRWQEQLTVVNPNEVRALQNSPVKTKPLHVKFFPESGSWLAGELTRMVATVTNAAGLGIAAQGMVADTSGQTIATFKSDQSGIAVFYLKATGQQELVAQVQADGHTSQQVKLPKPKQQGIAMSLGKVNRDGVQVKVQGEAARGYVLVAESEGKVFFAHNGTGTDQITVPWPATGRPAARLLLLNTGGLVEAEQRVYLPTTSGLDVQTDQKQYGTRQQVRVTVKGLSPGTMLTASVAAQRTALQQPVVFSPDAGVLQPLQTDWALWEAIAKGETEARYGREPLVEPLRQEGVAGPLQQVAYTRQIDTAFVQALPPHVLSYAQQHYTRTNINEVYGLTEPHAASPLPRLPVDRVFKLDDYIAFNDVEEAIREVTTNVRVSKRKGKTKVRLLYVAPGTKRMMKQEPLYLLDGVILDNMDEIMALNLNDIASIEIAWSEEKLYAGNLGRLVDHGMFAVYTKSGEARERLKEKGHAMLYEQFNLPRNFVVTTASDKSTTQALLPDFRQLLYWQPYLQAGPDGSASFTFYTYDETGVFEVKVQTADGLPARGEASFEVKLLN